jgi:hypothetical protein
LTKEECETSLYELKYYSNAYSNAHKSAIKEDVGKLQQLINEHFDNPPLKFEELKEGMWVWDNVSKRYMKVYDISYSEETFNVNGEWYLNDLYLEEFKFEENRFYRREVKEYE